MELSNTVTISDLANEVVWNGISRIKFFLNLTLLRFSLHLLENEANNSNKKHVSYLLNDMPVFEIIIPKRLSA